MILWGIRLVYRTPLIQTQKPTLCALCLEPDIANYLHIYTANPSNHYATPPLVPARLAPADGTDPRCGEAAGSVGGTSVGRRGRHLPSRLCLCQGVRLPGAVSGESRFLPPCLQVSSLPQCNGLFNFSFPELYMPACYAHYCKPPLAGSRDLVGLRRSYIHTYIASVQRVSEGRGVPCDRK